MKEKKLISYVLIKVSKGKTFANVLWKLHKEMDPAASRAMVVSARATQKGEFLILFDRSFNKKRFTAEVKIVVGSLGEVRPDPKKITVETSTPCQRGRSKYRDNEILAK